jgi:hypothetical protein
MGLLELPSALGDVSAGASSVCKRQDVQRNVVHVEWDVNVCSGKKQTHVGSEGTRPWWRYSSQSHTNEFLRHPGKNTGFIAPQFSHIQNSDTACISH